MTRILASAVFLFFLAAFPPSAIYAADVRILTPTSGFTTKRIQQITGTITGYEKSHAILIINGIPQILPITDGRFFASTVIAPGTNLIEVIAGRAKDSVSFYADVPKKDVKIVLIWDTQTDVDLWVIDPKGEKCYYSNSSTVNGGNLDMDNTQGYGPETFTMEKALPGSYSVQVQYYGSREAPVTRVNVYMILYEGTPKEERREFQFVMTKEHALYHIANFTIDAPQD